MNKEELRDLIDYAKEVVKGLLNDWHEKSMSQIRLDNANRQRIEEQKFYNQKEIYDIRNKR